MTPLLLLGCSDRKRTAAEPLPALQRYDGPAYRMLRAHRGTMPGILILSARFGLIGPDVAIPWYDERLTPARSRLLAADPPEAWIARLSAEAGRPLLCFAGVDYARVLRACHSAVEPVPGPIGLKLQRLRRLLDELGGGKAMGSPRTEHRDHGPA